MPRIKNRTISSSFSWMYFFFILSLIIHLARTTKIESNTVQYPVPVFGVKPERNDLVRAISNDFLDAVKMYANAGADLTSADNGLTPLMLACMHRNSDVIQYLIDKEVSLDEVSKFDVTNSHVLGFFLQHQATASHAKSEALQMPNKMLADSYSAISFLLFNRMIPYQQKIKLLKSFIKHGADLNLKINGETYLHAMAKENHLAEIFLLVKLGLEVNVQNKNGMTAIATAVKYNHPEAISTLVTLQASLTDGKINPVSIAMEKDSAELMKILLDLGGYLPQLDARLKLQYPHAFNVYIEELEKKKAEEAVEQSFSPLMKR